MRRALSLGLLLTAVTAGIVAPLLDSRVTRGRVFAMSPDGPTRARMALIATIALVLAVALGALRSRLRWHATTWRVLHGYLAVVVVALMAAGSSACQPRTSYARAGGRKGSMGTRRGECPM